MTTATNAEPVCCEMFRESGSLAHDLDCPSPLGADTWETRADHRKMLLTASLDAALGVRS